MTGAYRDVHQWSTQVLVRDVPGTSPMTGANRDVHQWSTQAMVREGNRDISNDWSQQGCAPVVNPSHGQRREQGHLQ